MSGPNEEGAQKNVCNIEAAVSVDQNDIKHEQDFIEFTLSDTEAKDQVFISAPNLTQSLYFHKETTGPTLPAKTKMQKVSNHPLNSKVYPRDPLLLQAQMRARNMKFALTRERKYKNRFLINTKEPWTLDERTKLMKALKKHGIFDRESLYKSVPTKTTNQIMDFIETAQAVTESTLNDKTKEKAASEDLFNPIAQWLYAMEAETGRRKDRYSAFNLMLPKVFLYISKFGNHPQPADCGGINYGQAYEYIYLMLSGQPGKNLSTETTRFMRKTLMNLSLRARNGTYEQVDYIKGIQATPTGLSNPHSFGAYPTTYRPNAFPTPSEKALLEVLSLPTANPLKVPMKILEFNRVTK